MKVEGVVNKQEACGTAKGEPDTLGMQAAATKEPNTRGMDAAAKDALREVPT
jgi:hypothetical protein